MTTTEKNATTEKPQPTVTDKTGKVWPLVFTVNLIKPMEVALGHPPREILTDPEKLLEFLTDPTKVAKVAYVLLEKPTPVALGVPVVRATFATEEEFAAGLDAEALDQAAEAVIRLVAGMFAPRGRKEEVADTLINLLKEAGAKAVEPQPEPSEQPAQAAA